MTIAWVFFRSGSIGEALHFLHYAFSPSHLSWFEYPAIRSVQLAGGWHVFVLMLFAFLLVSEEVLSRCQGLFTRYLLIDSIWLGLVVFLLLTVGVYNQNAFIYFQF